MNSQKSESVVQEGRGRQMDRRDASRSMFLDSISVEIPAARYYHALQGPELEILRETEELLLPLDKKWPFLLRFPNACFGMCLGLASQSSLWKALATSPALTFLHIPAEINLALWSLAVCTLILVSCVYVMKCVYHMEAVKREFCHPVRVNFFFAPWVACMTLTIAVPPRIAETVHPSVWCIFIAPLLALKLKIYGQWLFGGEKRLSKVANPATHLSVVGNFVGSLLAARVGWREPAKFFWAVGLAHYLVLFVTLYQRLPTSETLPKDLHPIYFLFIAAPATASWAWETIFGEFDTMSRISFSVCLFLYASLVVRFNFFRGFRFSISWWAYTYPMTSASIASIRYSQQVTHPLTQGLAILLSVVASITVSSLFVCTILHAFLWKTLFPNDMAIAVTTNNRRSNKKKKGLRGEAKDININEVLHGRKGLVRNSLDLMRVTVKNHRARLLQRKELPVYPDTQPRQDQERQEISECSVDF